MGTLNLKDRFRPILIFIDIFHPFMTENFTVWKVYWKFNTWLILFIFIILLSIRYSVKIYSFICIYTCVFKRAYILCDIWLYILYYFLTKKFWNNIEYTYSRWLKEPIIINHLLLKLMRKNLLRNNHVSVPYTYFFIFNFSYLVKLIKIYTYMYVFRHKYITWYNNNNYFPSNCS